MSKSRAFTRSLFIVADQQTTLTQLRDLKSSVKTVRFLQVPTFEQVAALPNTVKVIEAERNSSAFLLARPDLPVNVFNQETGNYEAPVQAGLKRRSGKKLEGPAPKKIKLGGFEDPITREQRLGFFQGCLPFELLDIFASPIESKSPFRGNNE